MLTIRMQRTGRKGLANFRVIVQDSRFSPNSGRVVAQLGSYNPHTKETTLDKEKAEQYLKEGAQPSDRVIRLLQSEKVKLPDWVVMPANDKKKSIRNPEKLRKNQPEEPKEEVKVEAEAPATEEPAAEKTEEPETADAETAETQTEEAPEEVAKVDEPESVEEPKEEKTEEVVEEKPATEEKPAESAE